MNLSGLLPYVLIGCGVATVAALAMAVYCLWQLGPPDYSDEEWDEMVEERRKRNTMFLFIAGTF